MNALSSTADYNSDGYAQLDLADTSCIQHTIGTATTAFNTSTAAESRLELHRLPPWNMPTARATAMNGATSGMLHTLLIRAGDTKQKKLNWKSGQALRGYYKLDASGNATPLLKATTSQQRIGKHHLRVPGKWAGIMSTALLSQMLMKQLCLRQLAAAGTTGGTGIISATFNTTEVGSGSTSSSSKQAQFRADAELAAAAAVGVESEYSDYDSTTSSSANWQADYDAAYSAAYSNAVAAERCWL